MKLAKVTGNVVCSQKLESLNGQKLLLIQPVDEEGKPYGNELVATDVAQAGPGDLVFFEAGREAAIALPDNPNANPSDATVMAIVDDINVEN